MAGDWMKIELELPDKPEVHAIAGMLNIDPDAVVGKLIRVWQWFNKHTEDGNAYGVTFALCDRIAGVAGFGEAMAFAGWLEQRDKTLSMPKFERHTSESSKTRALAASRQSKHRNKSNADSNADSNGAGVTEASPREEKRINKIKGKPLTQLPNDFTLNETSLAYASQRGVSITEELGGFKNWHEAKGSTYKDWQAAWRTWCDNAVKFGRAKQPTAEAPRIDTSIEAKREALQRMADYEFETTAWPDGEKPYRVIVTIENGSIKRTKQYQEDAA